MSASPLKADMCCAKADVGYGPTADMVSGRRFVMLDTPLVQVSKYKRGRAAIELSTKGLE
jgi:hypothetical protein